MLALFVSMAFLGLMSIDPVGIASMPVLLLQKRPIARSLSFLGGSLASLFIMGILLAKLLGRSILSFEHKYAWLRRLIEVIAAIILFVIAGTLYWQKNHKKSTFKLSGSMRQKLNLGLKHLFFIGALIVAAQSLLDVVFIIAMVRLGQIHMSFLKLVLIIGTYSLSALMIQLTIVVIFMLAPIKSKKMILELVNRLLNKYASWLLIAISIAIGVVLLILA